MTKKRQVLLIEFTILFFSIFFSGCLMNNQINALLKKGKPLNISVTNVQVLNNKIVVSGSNLDKVTSLNVNEGSNTIHFSIESQNSGSLVAISLSNVIFTSGKLFDFIFSSADAAATFTISFAVADNSITASMFTSMGASKGQVMKYNGTSWVPGPLTNAQIYLGTWDANTNTPDLSTPSTDPGDYYIVSNAGTFNSVSYAAGDWIISDGYNWQRVANSTVAVSSFNGRRGIVNLRPSDYVSLKDSVTHKITGSSLNDLADIDLTTILPLNGDVLTFNGVKWVAATPSSSGGAVSSVNGNTGAVTLTTTNISEGTNLYHTDSRVLSTNLTAVTLTNSLIAIGDYIQAALGKLQAQISSSSTSLNTKADQTNVAQTITALSVTGLQLPVASSDAVPKSYVDGFAQWTKNGSDAYFSSGNIGIGVTNPTTALQVNGTIYSSTGGFTFPDGTTQTTAASGATPAGADTQIQFNNAGVLGASSDFVWDNTKKKINITDTDWNITEPQIDINARYANIKLTETGASYGPGFIMATQGNGNRSAGVYIHNADDQTEWFYGRVFGTNSFGINYRSGMPSFGRNVSDSGAGGENNNLFTLTNSGNVGIGTNSPGYKLQVGSAGDGSEARANAWNVLSDERLKRDFVIIPNALEKTLSLHGYNYYWNRGTDQSKKLGLKAQEVKKVFPEVVSSGADGFLSVSYNHLVAAVIESLKEFFSKWSNDSKDLHLKVQELEKENKLLKEYLCEKDKKAKFCH